MSDAVLVDDNEYATGNAHTTVDNSAVSATQNEYATGNAHITVENSADSVAQVPLTSDAFLVYDNEYAGYITVDDDTIGWDGSPTLTT
eukprot:2868765-Amphidinium_carterae.1